MLILLIAQVGKVIDHRVVCGTGASVGKERFSSELAIGIGWLSTPELDQLPGLLQRVLPPSPVHVSVAGVSRGFQFFQPE